MNTLLHEILAAREQRVQTQRQLLAQYQKPLLCFTMNIPGPVKLDRDIQAGFYVGCKLLDNALGGRQILHRELRREITGCEAFYVVDMPPKELKRLAMDLEDIQPIGRLFDMDVLETDGAKLSREDMGAPRRTCLLCDRDAVICASSRAHSVEALQDRTGFLLFLANKEWLCEYIAVQAYQALNQEVSTTPKPGLVDRRNCGAHKDMNIRHFFASAHVLRPFFFRFAQEGFLTRDLTPRETFARIRPIGREAEQAMLTATHGVNTHKGAVFSLGLVCAAMGRLCPTHWQPENILSLCSEMVRGIVGRDFAGITPQTAKTAGEKIYAEYGISGVRGQAEAGFPAVLQVGLPIFRQGLARGLHPNDSGCITLLHLIAAADDTNLIHRSSRKTQLEIKKKIADILAEDPFPPLSVIEQLDEEFIDRNLSPGGSADLLSMVYLLSGLS